jgi:hypothetical protein
MTHPRVTENGMPQLIRLYLYSIAAGFALALVFTALLLVLDVASLRHLAGGTQGGWIAVLMLVVFHAILFSGVQFAVRIMWMAEGAWPGPGGGIRRLMVTKIRAKVPASGSVRVPAVVAPGTAAPNRR